MQSLGTTMLLASASWARGMGADAEEASSCCLCGLEDEPAAEAAAAGLGVPKAREAERGDEKPTTGDVVGSRDAQEASGECCGEAWLRSVKVL